MPNLYDQSQPLYPSQDAPQAPSQNTPWLAPWYGQSLPHMQSQPIGIFNRIQTFPQGPGGPAPAPQWGVAPQLPTIAPPQLPYPGQMSTMRGAPLTPNQTGLPYPAIPPSTDFGDPLKAQWEAAMNGLNARSGELSARRAYEGQLPMKWTAQGKVYDARDRALGAQSLYLSEQARNNALRLGEEQAIQAARNDPKNVIAVAREQRDRDNTDYRYRLAGLATPVEIQMPDGFQGPLPPGVRERLETIADKLTRQSNDKDKIRKYNEEAARIASDAAGHEVTAAEIAAGRVSLTLEQAEQAVRLAGYDVDQANLAESAAKLPPAPGLAWDEEGGQWVNKSDLADIKRLRENQGNEWADFSVSELITMLNADRLSPSQFAAILTNPNGKFGFLPTTVDHLLDLAAAQKSTRSQIDLSPFQPGAGAQAPGTGSGAVQQQNTGPTTTLPTSIGQFIGRRLAPR